VVGLEDLQRLDVVAHVRGLVAILEELVAGLLDADDRVLQAGRPPRPR